MKLLASFIVFIFLSVNVWSQKVYTLKILPKNSYESLSIEKALKQIAYKKAFGDSASRNSEIPQVLLKLQGKGYLAASFDSIYKDSTELRVFLHLGNLYKLMKLRKGNVPEEILSEVGFREKIYNNKPLNYKNIRKLQEKILTYCENNGYPFTSVSLDSVKINNDNISGSLFLDKKSEIKVDSISVKGTAKITKVYLHNYLSIKPGSLYNEALVKQISTRLKELPFLSEIKPFEIAFKENNAVIYLYLENKKASQFDFIAGLLPDNINPGKVIFTGEAHLKLHNSYGRGEILEINWKSPLPLTQDLKARLTYPFVLSTPFGLDLNFALYKKDTTFLDVMKNVGILYMLKGGNYIKVFVTDKQSSLLSTKRYENTTVRPEFLDVSHVSYGLGLKAEKLDYRFNPRRGFSMESSASVGIKEIKKNASIPAIIYDNLRLKTTQYNAEVTIDYFIPSSSRAVLNLGIKAATLAGPEVFKNELYRIGGLKTLRGFDEESIFASTYSINKIEYRYLLEQNSYMFAFYNIGFYENKFGTTFIKDQPYGFGAGITFETKLGIFSFTYALGKQFNNPLYLRSGKIHFGIISYF